MHKAEFSAARDLDRQVVTYTLTVDAVALANVVLDDVDRRLLRECDTERSSIADRLLALEMLMRRMQEQQPLLRSDGSG